MIPVSQDFDSMHSLNKIFPKHFFRELDNIEHAIFDLDGTIYPSLLILDIAKFVFSSDSSKYALKEKDLINLVQQSEFLTFEETTKNFVKLLSGEKRSLFIENCDQFLHNIYPNAIEFIKYLKSRGIKCHLISLTPLFIAKEVASYLGLTSFSGMKYSGKETKTDFIFDGNYLPVNDFKNFKLDCLKNTLKGVSQKKILFSGDSLDDLELFKFSNIKILVNNSTLINKKLTNTKIGYSFILNKRPDPWIELMSFIKN